MTLLISLFLLPFALVTIYFVAEILAGLRPIRTSGVRSLGHRSVIIVPAHDEVRIIAATLEALIPAAEGRAAILVVADNCTDGTAASVRELGIEVIERKDQARRGKGYALDFARRHLREDPPEVILVVDADCRTDGASIDALIGAVCTSGRPGQSVYLLQPEPLAPSLVQISNFAFCVKNLVRQRGLQRLAGRVQLAGTGMAFPWSLFDGADLATASIVEDLQLGLELAENGHPAQLVPDALVMSFSAGEEATLIQRARWEGGFMATAKNMAPAAFRRALKSRDAQGVIATFHLLVPPIALLVLLNFAVLALALLLTWLSHTTWLPVSIDAAIVAASLLAIFAAWVLEGQVYLSFRHLLGAPFYVLQKLAIYLKLIRRGAPTDWVRTKRPEDGAG